MFERDRQSGGEQADRIQRLLRAIRAAPLPNLSITPVTTADSPRSTATCSIRSGVIGTATTGGNNSGFVAPNNAFARNIGRINLVGKRIVGRYNESGIVYREAGGAGAGHAVERRIEVEHVAILRQSPVFVVVVTNSSRDAQVSATYNFVLQIALEFIGAVVAIRSILVPHQAVDHVRGSRPSRKDSKLGFHVQHPIAIILDIQLRIAIAATSHQGVLPHQKDHVGRWIQTILKIPGVNRGAFCAVRANTERRRIGGELSGELQYVEPRHDSRSKRNAGVIDCANPECWPASRRASPFADRSCWNTCAHITQALLPVQP